MKIPLAALNSRTCFRAFGARHRAGGANAQQKSAAQAQADQIRELEQFLAVYKKVKSSYVDKVDDKQLMEGAIQGMLASLDPHSGFLNKSDFSTLQTQIDGEYGGLGLSVTLEDEAVKVIAPTKDTPADKAGIKSGDYITHLDGKLIYGGTLDEAVEAMRGEPGTSIKLTIVRPGRDAPFDVSITRAIIDLKPVSWEVKDRIGVITITGFSEETGADVVAAVSSIKKSLGGKPLGYIVDLRSNPGGILDEAVAVSDAFLDSGEIVSERGRDKRAIERWWAESAVPGDVTGGAPIIVLVDAGSASASEIVAGALARPPSRPCHGRAQLWQGIGAECAAAVARHRASPDRRALSFAVGPVGAGRRDQARYPGAAAFRPRLQEAHRYPRIRPAPPPGQRDAG